MKSVFHILPFLLVLAACETAIEIPEEELFEPIVQKFQCNPKDICCFDLSDRAGSYKLRSKWEFVAFQAEKGSSFDNLTCLGRTARFTLGGEDYENIFKITLQFGEKASSLGGCEDLPAFSFRSFDHQIDGCFQADSEGNMEINFSPENVVYDPGIGSSTFPILEFEDRIKKSLLAVESYAIESNKLYLFMKDQKNPMVFLALKD
ncbi:MAG: hypothetical protein NXH89_05305 [Cyclobacteriaceae bacterium]|nr:hypothetical protein [Cyclobacteriaceae bacterium]